MANLVASDLTYTAEEPSAGDIVGISKSRKVWAITTAAGDYPTGGLPLDNDRLGMPNSLESLIILEPNAANTDIYKWDKSANTIKVFQEGAAVYIEHPNTAYTSPDELIIEVVGW